MQVLKDEVRTSIFDAGVQIFYEKDFRSAKMQDIAKRAGVSASLLYSYYENKENLFDAIASSLPIDFERIAREEERQPVGLPSEKYQNVTKDYLLDMLENHRLLVIVMDKSSGTGFEHTKDDLITSIERHIKHELDKRADGRYPNLLAHVLASNFAESLLEVARHYQGKEEARQMLGLLSQCYYEGVNSL